jgi:cytochrome c
MSRAVALLAWLGGAIGAGAFAATPPRGDADRGAEIYTRCQACHALQYDRAGPRHCGLIGRRAGSVPGFEYSPAMKHSKLTWDETSLDRFLANPPVVVPGTTMTYAGVADPQERADLIIYLREAGKSAACRLAPSAAAQRPRSAP